MCRSVLAYKVVLFLVACRFLFEFWRGCCSFVPLWVFACGALASNFLRVFTIGVSFASLLEVWVCCDLGLYCILVRFVLSYRNLGFGILCRVDILYRGAV